jgi:hypothetical protein
MGSKNKLTVELKEMVFGALQDAGGQEYLLRQTDENPKAFLALVGKFVPRDIRTEVGPQLGAMLQEMLTRRAGRSKPVE